MTKKIKNRHRQNQKKAQKKKKRQEKIKKQALSNQATTQENIENIVDHALELVEEGDWKGGLRILEKLKEKHGHHAHVNYGLGVIAAFDDRLDDAVRLFGKAVQISPDFVEAHFNLGVACQKQYKLPEMIMAYRQVLKIDQTGGYMVQHVKDLLDSLEQQVQDSHGIGLNDYLLGYEIFEQGVKFIDSEDWEAAITKFNDTIKIVPNHTQAYGNLGICYSSVGRKQEALDALDKAIELDPYYEVAIINRKAVESIKEGECLRKKIKSVYYYKDIPLKNKSFTKMLAEEKSHLTEKK